VPRSFFSRPPPRLPGLLFLERTCRTKVEDNFGLCVRKLYRLDPALFSDCKRGASELPGTLACRRVVQSRNSPVPAHPTHSTPPTPLWAIWLVFGAPEGLPNSGQKDPYPLPRPAGGVLILEPFRERPAGPKHTRAEQDES